MSDINGVLELVTAPAAAEDQAVGRPERRPEPTAVAPVAPEQPAAEGDLLDAYSRAVVGVVREVGPAVVNIEVRHRTGPQAPGEGRGRGGHHPGHGGPNGPAGGSGSGFCFTPDGFI